MKGERKVCHLVRFFPSSNETTAPIRMSTRKIARGKRAPAVVQRSNVSNVMPPFAAPA
jgi:hypothetical protein